jgi:hypothetical protein
MFNREGHDDRVARASPFGLVTGLLGGVVIGLVDGSWPAGLLVLALSALAVVVAVVRFMRRRPSREVARRAPSPPADAATVPRIRDRGRRSDPGQIADVPDGARAHTTFAAPSPEAEHRLESLLGASRGSDRDPSRIGGPADDGPPRSAYALLDAPEVAVVRRAFAIDVGLAPHASPDVYGEPLRVPDDVTGAYTLTVQVVADGFSLVTGDDWRVQLQVSGENPYPSATLHLIADAQPVPVLSRTLQALFDIGGQTIGLAYRSIAVVRNEALVSGRAPDLDRGAFDVAVPSAAVAPDLTVRIVRDERDRSGRLLWTFSSPHPIELPAEEIVCDIGSEPSTLAARLVRKMPSYEGQPDLYDYVAGIGDTIAENVPSELWRLLAAVAHEVAPEAPSLLFLSAEPYVPWELARMEEPLTADAPPLLAAQVRVGRWVLGKGGRPRLPPPSAADAQTMAVVSGVYDIRKWRRLLEAEQESSDLQTRYGATPVNADRASVLKCVKGDPDVDILHFSVHGRSDHSGMEDGLILVDGQTLDPLVVRGNRFASPRFVFLNACQVGAGDEILGDYAGLAAAFLHAGAAGVIAPLWSIDDVLARELAVGFYEAAFAGVAPAEVLRSKRASFREDVAPQSSTFIAYQYFGHPEMRLVRD